jgi:hypothetical protein
MDEFYSVDIDGNKELGGGPFACINEDLVDDETGIAFDLFVPNPKLVKARAILAHRRKKLPDRFHVLRSTWFLISPKAWQVFQMVRCCKSICWIPTSISNKDGVCVATYHLAYGFMQHDIWDYSRSNFYWYPGRTPGTAEAAGYMRKGIIDPLKVPKDVEFFRATRQKCIGTRRLCELIREHELTGFSFQKIET